MKRSNLLKTAFLVLCASPAALHAQADRLVMAPPPMQGPGVVGMHVDLRDAPDKLIKGQPFSAEIQTTHVQVLADGNRITNSGTSHFYRDGEGRTRRENSIVVPGQTGTVPKIVMINDPVAGVRYIVDENLRTATKMKGGFGLGGNFGYTTSHKEGKRIEKHVFVARTDGPIPDPVAVGPLPGAIPMEGAGNEQPEDLGDQTMEGVVVHGTRLTHTIAAGAIGNEKPITVTTERWYATDLGMDILKVHNDPWSGEVTTKVTNITRGEPDASLFAPPSDYKVTEMKEFRKEFEHFKKAVPPPPPPAQ